MGCTIPWAGLLEQLRENRKRAKLLPSSTLPDQGLIPPCRHASRSTVAAPVTLSPESLPPLLPVRDLE